MAKSLDDMIKANNDALTTLTAATSRLEDLRDNAGTLADMARCNAQILRAHADQISVEIVNAHLRAANVVVQPMSPQLEAELTKLADKLDKAIKSDALLNAVLDTVKDFIQAAERVSHIVDDHT